MDLTPNFVKNKLLDDDKYRGEKRGMSPNSRDSAHKVINKYENREAVSS